MASTRNKNTIENYTLEQRALDHSIQYRSYENASSGNAYVPLLPGNGLGGARVPRSELSQNSEDVESYLFGIGSTNLVNPRSPTAMQAKHLKTAEIADRLPLFLPDPLVIEKSQRPNFLS